ncbi:MAG: flagellar basal body L-ring protein FlgH [Kangiellaceae bacterium]|nr:flagellar basal body L-ring protein FlgH [Kangiellaceae bacterium]
MICLNIIRAIIAVFAFVLISGCSTIYLSETADDPNWAPSFPDEIDQSQNATGSIYNVASARMLFQDKKALRIGDIITVVLSESTRATKTADTELSKDTSVNTTPPTLLGNVPDIGMGTTDLGITITSANAFKAETDSAQSNLLNGIITVTVQKVYSNGNLAIKGEKWISLNQGNEYIRISGLIRPEDIDKDNQVVSTKVADARIYYGGSGPLAEANEEGWLGRFFNSVWWPL